MPKVAEKVMQLEETIRLLHQRKQAKMNVPQEVEPVVRKRDKKLVGKEGQKTGQWSADEL